MRSRVDILGVLVDQVDMNGAVNRIEEWILNKEGKMVVTPNAEMIIRAYYDDNLRQIINSAQLIIPDGAGVVLAARLLGVQLQGRVAGIDLVERLFEEGARKGYTLYFLGGKPGVAKLAAFKVKERYSELKIKAHHGYLDRELEEKILNEIKRERPDILLVGMGVPLQEMWLKKYLPQVEVGVGVGVGGSFDILAGNKRRAPQLLQNLNLEWFYRLLQEPERLGRVIKLPEFIYKVLQQRLNRLK